MNLISLFVLLFGASTIIGVPLLSSFQITQIKGSSWADWGTSLGTSLGPATGVFLSVCVIVYFVIRPLSNILKKAETEELTPEEQQNARKTLSKINIISIIFILAGYPIGNGTSIIIKTLAGKVKYNALDLTIIMILIILYAIIGIQYSVNCFNTLCRKQLAKLKIESTENLKNMPLSMSLGAQIFSCFALIGWHCFCSGYSAVRNHWTSEVFMRKALFSICQSLFLTLPLMIISLRQLTKRFSETVSIIKKLRTNGNLTEKMYIGAFDDFGQVMSEINLLVLNLKTAFTNLKKENSLVDSGAEELLNVTEKSSAGISQIVETFLAMSNEHSKQDQLLSSINAGINKLNSDALKVTEFMDQQEKNEEENTQSMIAMVENFNSITQLISKAQNLSRELIDKSITGNNEVKKTQEVINGITEMSQRMIEVIKVIQSVASQTNLLAMNAAIEAAHAGEAGKGFSVVADEIRKLSESTQKSAKDISNLINEVAKAMESGSSNMNATSAAFNIIRTDIEEQNSVVDEISRTVSTQSSDASSILTNTKVIVKQIAEVNTLTKNQANYTEEIKGNVDNIVQYSEKLNTYMEESGNVVNDFSESFQTVKEKAEDNKKSVLNITAELNKYTL